MKARTISKLMHTIEPGSEVEIINSIQGDKCLLVLVEDASGARCFARVTDLFIFDESHQEVSREGAKVQSAELTTHHSPLSTPQEAAA